ncbi:MAG: OmpA family protein [Eubacteriales bacterium]|nr:OmpA family protein [Eubacteriales bacterium]
MRRARSYSPSAVTEGGEQGFWPSYADMMSAVALILFFLMLLSYISNLITGNDLRNTQEMLSDTQAQVAATQSQVVAAQAEYDKAVKELEGLTADLNRKQDELEAFAIQIAQQTDTISEQEKLIGDQKAYLAAANDEIVAMRNQMQTIAVLRLSILNKIKESIVDVMGDSSKVSIGDNGNIILSEGVFFDLGSSAIKPESEAVLNELIDVFSAFLANPENAKYVDSIVISGHTDSTGTDEDNRVLSTDRANSVLGYLLTGKGAKLGKYAEYFCAAGYGETRPVASNDTAAGQAQNRRIEISMILKDETVLDIVEQYLALDLPESKNAAQTAKAAPAPTDKPWYSIFG